MVAKCDEVHPDVAEDFDHVLSFAQIAKAGWRKEIAENANTHLARQLAFRSFHHVCEPRQQQPARSRIVRPRVQKVEVVQLHEDVEIEVLQAGY